MNILNDHIIRLVEEIAEAEKELSKAESGLRMSHGGEFQTKYEREIHYYNVVINRKMELLKLLKGA